MEPQRTRQTANPYQGRTSVTIIVIQIVDTMTSNKHIYIIFIKLLNCTQTSVKGGKL